MENTLTRFAQALRSAGLEISAAETLDAAAVLHQLGVQNRARLRSGWVLAFAKTQEAKPIFHQVFDDFFGLRSFAEPVPPQLAQQIDSQALMAFAQNLSAEAQAVLKDVISAQGTRLLLRLQALQPPMQNLRQRTLAQRSWEGAVALPELRAARAAAPESISSALGYVGQYLQDEVAAFAQQQYAQRVDRQGNDRLTQQALATSFAHVPPAYYERLDQAARQLAEQLRKSKRKRLRRKNHGKLNVPQTLRINVGYDGTMMQVAWRHKQRRPAKVFVVCDVSNSVRATSRLLLTFLFALGDALPHLRGFVFSNRLGEITHQLRNQTGTSNELALASTLERWGQGRSDYGQAFVDLQQLVKSDLDRRSTLIMLGDARNNSFPARTRLFAQLARRAGRVYWLNPEAQNQWGEGDSVMPLYQAHCLEALTCNKLPHLQRLASRLLPK